MTSPCFYYSFFGFDFIRDQIMMRSICFSSFRRLFKRQPGNISLFGTMVSATCCGFVHFFFFCYSIFWLACSLLPVRNFCSSFFCRDCPLPSNQVSSTCSSVTLSEVGHTRSQSALVLLRTSKKFKVSWIWTKH